MAEEAAKQMAELRRAALAGDGAAWLRLGEPTVNAFRAVVQRVACPYARSSILLGAPVWDADLSPDTNFLHAVPNLRRLAQLNMAVDAQPNTPDGLVLEVPIQALHLKTEMTVESLGLLVGQAITTLAGEDAGGCSSVRELLCKQADAGWRFSFAGCGMFLTTFAPCYPESSSRYQFGACDGQSCFILFQPDAAFARRGVTAAQMQTIRAKFAAKQQPYRGEQGNAVVKPLNEYTDLPVEWWKIGPDGEECIEAPVPVAKVVLPPLVEPWHLPGWMTGHWMINEAINDQGVMQILHESWKSSLSQLGAFTSFGFNDGILTGCDAVRRFANNPFRRSTRVGAHFGFHGTSADAAGRICREGFDPTRRKIQTYGPGEYLALRASDAAGYCKGSGILVFALCVAHVNHSADRGPVQAVFGMNLASASRSGDFDGPVHQFKINNPLDCSFSFILPLGMITFNDNASGASSSGAAAVGLDAPMLPVATARAEQITADAQANADRITTAARADAQRYNEELARRVEDLTRRLEEANERAARSERKLDRQWVVDKDDVTLFEQIGRGTFGTVHRGRWQGCDVAVKTVTEQASEAEKKVAAKLLVNEVRVLKRVRHVNVVQILGACSEPPMLLMQLAPRGRTLRHELDDASSPPAIARRVHIVRGVCAGMVALHSHRMLHLDIKSTNVVIGGDGTPLIADFGLSVEISKTLSSVASARMTGGRGTFQYKAPELFNVGDENDLEYDKPADVYSFAMLVWETFTDFVPWTGPSAADKKTDVQITTIHVLASQGNTPLRPPLHPLRDTCPPKIVDLIQECWAQNPVKRPTFDATLVQLDAVASEFPTEDAGRRAGAAASNVEELERRLAIAETERDELEQSAAHNQAEIDAVRGEVEALIVERDGARRDLDAIGVVLRAATVTFPETWTAQADDGGDRGDIEWWRSGRQLVAVDTTTSEWALVKELLTMSLPSAMLVKVERWENRLLWRDYWTKRQHLEVKRRGKANEQRLWHGTGKTPPATVLAHEVGPDPRFAKGGFYGPGLYLAGHARYSNHDQYVHRCQEHRQLLLCRAALGESFDFGEEIERDLKKPPTESDGVLYDSVRGGPHRPTRSGAGDDDSPMFVLYELAQAYPEYVVSYKLK